MGDNVDINNVHAESVKHVLLALPSWAVDIRRARWLVRYGDRKSVNLRMVKRYQDEVCLQFVLPQAMTLMDYLYKKGTMDEDSAAILCKELLQMLNGLNPGVTHWGFIDSSMVYVNGSGQLVGVLPIGVVLSQLGVKAVTMNVLQRGAVSESMVPVTLPPEIRDAAIRGGSLQVIAEKHFRSTDTFACALIVLEALSKQSNTTPRGKKLEEAGDLISSCGNDFLKKALFPDPAWRLSDEDALTHPWLRRGSQCSRV